MIDQLTFQALEYFIAAVEQGSFSKAADICFITQPALSRAISKLEEEIGKPLFVRQNKGVSLTEVGEVFYKEVRKLLDQRDSFLACVKSATPTSTGIIKIGYIMYGYIQLMNNCLANFSAEYPNINIETVYDTVPAIKSQFINDNLDIALLPEAAVKDLGNIDFVYIAPSVLYVLVPFSHPLFDHKEVSLEQLACVNVVLYDPITMAEANQRYLEICREAGFVPKIVGTGKMMSDITTLALTKSAIGFCTKASAFLHNEKIHHIPVCDHVKGVGVLAVRKRTNINLISTQLINHIKNNCHNLIAYRDCRQ